MQNHNLKFKIFFHVVIFSVVSLTLHFETAEASTVSLGIYPPIITIDALPPASIQTPITLQNFQEETIIVKPVIKFFTAQKEENGTVNYLETKQVLGADPLLLQKIQLFENDTPITTLAIAPKQQKTINLHIGLLKDDPASDYYFSIIFMTQKLPQDENTKGNISDAVAGIATNVLLSVGPKGKAKGIIKEFSVPFFIEKGPVPFTLRVANTGNNVITPQGNIVIKNMFGQAIGKVELMPVNILKDTTRAIPDILQSPNATQAAAFKALPLETRTKWHQLTTFSAPKALWPESFLFGIYSATLTLSLSEQGPIFTRAIYFAAFPLQSALGLLLGLFIVILIKNKLQNRLRSV